MLVLPVPSEVKQNICLNYVGGMIISREGRDALAVHTCCTVEVAVWWADEVLDAGDGSSHSESHVQLA